MEGRSMSIPEEKKAFNKAWIEAWARMPAIHKGDTADTGKYSYSYASLPDIISQVRPILAEHGFAVTQSVTTIDGDMAVTTVVSHVDGWDLEYGPLCLPAGNTPQQAGSAITYGRRYGLAAALGIAPDDDDDAASVEPRRAVDRSNDPHEQAWQNTLSVVGRADAPSVFLLALSAAGVRKGDRADEGQAALIGEFVKTRVE
jgi:hypothetical protein